MGFVVFTFDHWPIGKLNARGKLCIARGLYSMLTGYLVKWTLILEAEDLAEASHLLPKQWRRIWQCGISSSSTQFPASK